MEICNMLIAHQARRRAFLQQESSYFLTTLSWQKTPEIFHVLFSRSSIALRVSALLKFSRKSEDDQLTIKKAKPLQLRFLSYIQRITKPVVKPGGE
jgi:hypothetical protein